MDFDEGWQGKKTILVILAHPDDPEFFCGASIARWIAAGHEVHYCLLTKGDKGTSDPTLNEEMVAAVRVQEQTSAAAFLGVKELIFLDYKDGYVMPDLQMRKNIIRVIRTIRPDILVTCDPTNVFIGERYYNHPDHRAAGSAVADAYFPGAGSRLYFPELVTDEGLQPHRVGELWFSLAETPNIVLDVTEFWDTRIKALLCHKSQIGDEQQFIEKMKSRRCESSPDGEIYEEAFRRIIYT